jgi:chromosome segregation ATPase
MRRRGLSVRLERHLERGEELMELNRRELELNRAAAERNTQAFERLMAAFDRHEEAFERHEKAFERVPAALEAQESRVEDLKVFIRETNRRSERVIQDLLDGTEKVWNEIKTEIKEGREEARAQTQALLALIDRFPPPAQAA